MPCALSWWPNTLSGTVETSLCFPGHAPEQLRVAGSIALQDPKIVFGIHADRGNPAMIGPIVVRGEMLKG